MPDSVSTLSSIIALADDISGAAEIAGVAHRHGLLVRLITSTPNKEGMPGPGEALVIDTDTRRLSGEQSFSLHQQIAATLGKSGPRIYKKTESVLRGHIPTEIRALLESLPHRDALLVPANPARKRTIQDGVYRIGGIPLHQTEFANDPAFPITSAKVTEVLPGFQSLPMNSTLSPTSNPARLFIGDALQEADLQHWAREVTRDILPAGASPFFGAWLKHLGFNEQIGTTPWDKHTRILVVSGSFSGNSRQTAAEFREKQWPVLELHEQSTVQLPPDARIALLKLPPETVPNPETLVEGLTKWLKDHLARIPEPPTHILIEGGETAASIMHSMHWENFSILREWEPGTVSLKVFGSQAPVITIKPGSYPWPGGIF